jgi:phosphatidylinositol glycan class C protein
MAAASANATASGGAGGGSKSGGAAATDGRTPRPWKKVLFQLQSQYADNHVDVSFLNHLVLNADVEAYDVVSTLLGSMSITQQVSAVAILLVTFMHIASGVATWGVVLGVDLALLCVGYLLTGWVRDPLDGNAGENFLSLCLFAGILRVLAPVLRTLTSSYSEDTIWALALTLSAVHVFVHDYRLPNALNPDAAKQRRQGRGQLLPSKKPSSALALNAIFFAAVLLASRLPLEDVFGFALFTLELFALMPLLIHSVRLFSTKLSIALTLLMIVIAAVLLRSRDTTLLVAYLLLIVVINLVAPFWLLYIQKYKHRISGPWDIAHVSS